MNLKKMVALAIIHLLAFGVFFFPFQFKWLALCIVSYFVRMLTITAGYHRYFSHRSFKTSRFFQFILAFTGTTAAQKGILWWAANHRAHHRHSDQTGDSHSPRDGFFWSHAGWVLANAHDETRYELIPDLIHYPELDFLNRWYLLPPLLLASGLLWLGGWPAFFWGFILSTLLVMHSTFSVNSFGHRFGTRAYETSDDSRNNLLLAVLALGDGWHNNHHASPSSARHGFTAYEIDVTYLFLKLGSILGVLKDLRMPSSSALAPLKNPPSKMRPITVSRTQK